MHIHIHIYMGFPGFSDKKKSLECRRPGFDPWIRKMPYRKESLPTVVFLPGESHGPRSLMDYSPLDCKDTTEQLSHTYTSVYIYIYTHIYIYIHIYNI